MPSVVISYCNAECRDLCIVMLSVVAPKHITEPNLNWQSSPRNTWLRRILNDLTQEPYSQHLQFGNLKNGPYLYLASLSDMMKFNGLAYFIRYTENEGLWLRQLLFF